MKYNKLYIYSDGGCINTQSRTVGAYAYIITCNNTDNEENETKLFEGSNSQFDTTNNKMELLGAIEGFKKVENEKLEYDELIVRSDSMYLIKGVTRWVENWKRNNWKTNTGGDVKNQDYWLKLDYFKNKLKPIMEWVKGHKTTKFNIECDAQCSKLIKKGVEELQK